MNGIFVTATDTEVGKTVIAASMAAVFRERGRDVGVMKPVASGCRCVNGNLVSDDSMCLVSASGSTDPMSMISPFSYEPPVAPTVAAKQAGRSIDLEIIADTYSERSERHEVMVVEGIGGLMVPLDDTKSVLDMVKSMGLPVLIVARPALGTINHTLLTVFAAESTGIEVAAVVLNRFPANTDDMVLLNNPKEIADRVSTPVYTFPESQNIDVERRSLDGAIDHMRDHPVMDAVERMVT